MASKTAQPQAHLAMRLRDDPVITIFRRAQLSYYR
jgi:hypothetical protein